jgi:3'-phosphoadenosine 5'-phosphosulfate sulfotransferase (PAPS reductase)/FAD synthetase
MPCRPEGPPAGRTDREVHHVSIDRQSHLKRLEDESIHIMREVAAEFRNPR